LIKMLGELPQGSLEVALELAPTLFSLIKKYDIAKVLEANESCREVLGKMLCDFNIYYVNSKGKKKVLKISLFISAQDQGLASG